MITRTRLIAVIAAVGLAVAACGGSGGSPATTPAAPTTTPTQETTTSQTAPAALTRGSFPSGATAEYPGDWGSFGVGMSGSLELVVPGKANVSLRDAAASEYIGGPMFSGAESAAGAFSVLAALLGVEGVTPQAFASESAREVLYALAEVNGAQSLFAVTPSGDGYASVFAPSLSGPLDSDTVTSILEALATVTP